MPSVFAFAMPFILAFFIFDTYEISVKLTQFADLSYFNYYLIGITYMSMLCSLVKNSLDMAVIHIILVESLYHRANS